MHAVFSWLVPVKRLPSVADCMEVVTSVAALARAEVLPVEIQYVLAKHPERIKAFRGWIHHGYGIGVRTVERTPERVRVAVDRISRLSQENTVLPWLPRLLREEATPMFTQEDVERAEQIGVNLHEETRIILAERFAFRKIILVDLKNQGINADGQELMRQVNEDISSLALCAAVECTVRDSAHAHAGTGRVVAKAAFIIGPIAHILERWVGGLGKAFAAIAEDLFTETAETFTLRGSGFTWRQLVRRKRLFAAVLMLATYGAFQVEPLMQAGYLAWAGAVFGLSAVALPLVMALRSIGMHRQAYLRLTHLRKRILEPGQTIWGAALREDAANPARRGAWIGIFLTPFVAAAVFSLLPQWTGNGWFLALLASVESISGSVTIAVSRRAGRWRLRRTALRAMTAALPRQTR